MNEKTGKDESVALSGGGMRPKDAREVRVWNYLNGVQDDFWPIFLWPAWAQTSALSEHRSNLQRFQYFYFLVGNGLAPDIATEWVVLKDVLAGKEMQYGLYDRAAVDQLNWLKVKAKKKELFNGRYRVFDMILGHPVHM